MDECSIKSKTAKSGRLARRQDIETVMACQPDIKRYFFMLRKRHAADPGVVYRTAVATIYFNGAAQVLADTLQTVHGDFIQIEFTATD